ncbi:MAG: biotin transporter BioY [Vampirovibrionales bacterium]|nr:biotin transporter BioY [Vampirovibrionales bacterium]
MSPQPPDSSTPAASSPEIKQDATPGKCDVNLPPVEKPAEKGADKIAIDAPKSSLHVLEKKTVPTTAPYAKSGASSAGKVPAKNSVVAKAPAQAASIPIPLQRLDRKPFEPFAWLTALYFPLHQPPHQTWLKKMREQEMVQNISKPPKVHPNSLLVMTCGTLVMALQGYLNMPLPNLSVDMLNTILSWFNVPQGQWFESLPIQYNFQLPLALLMGGLLGSFLGGVSVLSYILVGLFLAPVFANGGGLNYIYQPGFPFLIAMIAGAVYAGQLLRRAFHHRKPWKQTLFMYSAGILSVAFTHGLGLIGLTSMLLVTSPFMGTADPIGNWLNWVVHLSLEPLPYDVLATSIFLWFVRYIRLSIYPALY